MGHIFNTKVALRQVMTQEVVDVKMWLSIHLSILLLEVKTL